MQLKIEKSKFKEYSLDKISQALQNGLSSNYKVVEVSIVDCPNSVSYTHLTLPTIYSV